jgi:hypothetical protein
MRKILLATAAITGLLTLISLHASAAPLSGLSGAGAVQAHDNVTNVDWDGHHHYWHHRRWYHGRWHYWD